MQLFWCKQWNFKVSQIAKFLLISQRYVGLWRKAHNSKPNSPLTAKCLIHNAILPKLSIIAIEGFFFFFLKNSQFKPYVHGIWTRIFKTNSTSRENVWQNPQSLVNNPLCPHSSSSWYTKKTFKTPGVFQWASDRGCSREPPGTPWSGALPVNTASWFHQLLEKVQKNK